MITIKRICLFVTLTALLLSPLGAETKSFSISPQAGFLYGQSEEIVFMYPKSNNYLSELLWDIKPLVYAGIAANFEPIDPFNYTGLSSSLSLKIGIPLNTGIMEDRDWMNPSHNYPTHYSRHDNYTKSAILSDLSVGYSWRLNDFLSLKAFAEFSFMHFSWSGENGYYQYPTTEYPANYPPWNDDLPKIYFEDITKDGRVILYSQNWFIFAPGISLKCRLGNITSLEGIINYTPLIYCSDRDDHLLTGSTYYDYTFFGHYLKGSGAFHISASDNLSFSLALSYKLITGTRGDIYEGKYYSENLAGTGFSAFDLAIAATIRLFNR
ncbi:MAG: omptin family outer membrane protease [Treponema sp.]|nr:omptin family outer membrane protease [Treponema sp.]